MKKFKLLVCILSIVLFASASVNVFADDSNWGKLTSISGDVSIKRSGGEKTFKAIKNMRILEGDTVITGSGAKASLMLSNSTKIIIDENSIVNLSAIRESVDSGKTTQIDLKAGSIYNSVKEKLGSKDKYEVYTPNAVAGVRGTEFFVKYDFIKKLTTNLVQEGIVDMFKEPTINNAGDTQGIRILDGEIGYGNDTAVDVDLYKKFEDEKAQAEADRLTNFDDPKKFNSKLSDTINTKLELVGDNTQNKIDVGVIENIIYSPIELVDVKCDKK